jgi:hypothetical protein
MAPCKDCSHVRAVGNANSLHNGFIECKPPVEPGLWLRAFYSFAANGAVTEPFNVNAAAGMVRDAWPFQFRANHIDRCDGFLAKSASHESQIEPEATAPRQ